MGFSPVRIINTGAKQGEIVSGHPVLWQLALTRHGKAFESLAPEEKKTLQNDLIVSVFALARQVDEPFRRGY